MSGFPMSMFLVLFGAGTLAAVLVMPYALTLNKDKLEGVKMPLPVPLMLLLSVVQSSVLIAIASAVGLLAAKAVGLTFPVLDLALAGESFTGSLQKILPLAIALGALIGAVIVFLDKWAFVPRMPEALKNATPSVALWKRALACFYGGIAEEILMRLFLMSGLIWLLSRIWTLPAGLPTPAIFWTANIAAGVIFGLGHLPATAAITKLTPLIVLRAISLNLVGGLVFGYLFWQYGLVAAMIAHFAADIVLHIISPALLKPQKQASTVAVGAQ